MKNIFNEDEIDSYELLFERENAQRLLRQYDNIGQMKIIEDYRELFYDLPLD